MNAKKLLTLSLALALSSSVIACGSGGTSVGIDPDTGNPPVKQSAGGACTADDQCDPELFCEAGICTDPSDPVKPAQCEGTGCAEGYTCNPVDHQCYLQLQPAPPPLEQVCTTNADCGSGFHCESGACEPGAVLPVPPQPIPPLPPAVQIEPVPVLNEVMPVMLLEPKVVEVTPTDGHKYTITTPTITVTFNSEMDAASVKESFRLYMFDILWVIPVDGTVTGTGKVFQFTPKDGSLKNGALYEIRVEAGVKNKFGTPMADQFHSAFETFK